MAQAAPEVAEQKREVLPTNVRPEHYFVSYSSIDLVKEFKFNGAVTIDLKVAEESTTITLNAADIEFKSIVVSQGDNSQKVDVAKLTNDEKTEQWTIPLTSALKEGSAKLMIEFVGSLNDKMKGFYRSKYKLSDGNDGFCGCTQFEATDARRAFPCWDEPAAKATFSVEMTCPKELTVLSNMPEIDRKELDDDKNVTVLFDKTPIMSTYLLAWVIGEFESVESKTSRDILVRVWTTIGRKSEAEFACDVACRCLDFYEKYFEIEYPLPKCDMIAVPDFAAGAMENWGLVTYREVALLCDKEKASLKAKQYVLIVVCHELAHQWFGNLVTMDWWSQLWLNEGFACFMEYLSSAALHPDWKMWNMFLLSEYLRAFELDGMTTSHPIEVDVNTAAEAEEVFDTISYCKGACVIRMLESYLGKEVFRKALNKYLNKFKYSNAVTTDLWHYMASESKKPVALIMENWTRKQGFPLISASRSADGGTLTLKQQRFLISGDDEEKTTWNVPMCLRVEGEDKIQQILLDEAEKTFDVSKSAKFVHINADSTGFYCCNYDEGMTEQISSNLSSLSQIDRICLIRDTKSLAVSGVPGATVKLLGIVAASKDEADYPVWDALLSAMADVVHIVDGDEEIMKDINAIMVKTLGGIYKKLGFDPAEEQKDDKEDETTSGLFRPLILGAMAKYKNEQVIAEMMKRFHAFMDNKYDDDALSSSIRGTTFANCIKNGKEKEYNALKQYYNTTENPLDKSSALRSLGMVRYSDKAMSDFLEWVISSDEVRSQDKVFPYRSMASSGSKGREMAWQFLQKRWDEWFKLFEGGFLIQHLAKIPSGFVTAEKAKEVEDYYAKIDAPACKRAMKQCIENISQNASWRAKELDNIRKWAQAQSK